MQEFLSWLSGNRRVRIQSLASLSGLRIRIAMSCGVGHSRSSDPAFHRLVVPIQPLAWELPYAVGVALKKQTKEKKKKREKKQLKPSFGELSVQHVCTHCINVQDLSTCTYLIIYIKSLKCPIQSSQVISFEAFVFDKMLQMIFLKGYNKQIWKTLCHKKNR